ncbi:MAG: DEAD/DEAH box helicase family protein, partial [Bacteroidales bacterium]|nr:DEAD/DEAH box helicase family protein [Bacteroidales bacterium]
GKTITSLNCILNEYLKTNSYKVVILVPTIALVEQWKNECAKFNFRNIISVSSKGNWNEALSFFNTASKIINTSYIVIATYASFVRKRFQNQFKSISKDAIFIADEVHNMGASSISKLLPGIHIEKRIGLSATPQRKYDYEGNIAIEEFFNDTPPFIYSFSMKQALDMGWLSKYLYYPHIVYLEDDELKQYIKISKQLLKFLDPATKKYKDVSEVEMLLLARKRIIHKAREKKSIFRKILKTEFEKKRNLKYTLVYVPEGKDPDYSSSDYYIEDEDEFKLINDYTRIVSDIDSTIMVKQYTSKTNNRHDVIKDFEEGRIHVLTSMKCLDEGVDVPRSELAVFCASTGNPRQFIQRRGRVLRLHKEKIHAVIHDLVVVTKINPEENTYEMERSLIKKELERVVDFSGLSMNKIDSYEELKNILDYYNLNLNDI